MNVLIADCGLRIERLDRLCRSAPARLHSLLPAFAEATARQASRRCPKQKTRYAYRIPGFLFWRRPTLAQPIVALPSGLQRFTSVFGMGTGGTTALGSPERKVES